MPVQGPLPDPLTSFLPPISSWFRAALGEPTAPQRLGWPVIAAGRNALICAPTGSGKTLTAFLACLDQLWRAPVATPGVRVLYVSPLKALNQDIAFNLDAPLAGILSQSHRLGTPLPPLSVAIRTGDTPTTERQRIARRPPDILITTPESLHLMLTSRARNVLTRVSHVIIDEIHALAPNKRGVFLALLLERLESLNPSSFIRIGLSATQRPLEEVARYLGGLRPDGRGGHEARPVTIVDAGRRKDLDLEVSFLGRASVGRQESAWPVIEDRLCDLITSHHSTIVFTNNRRVAERLTAHLNERVENQPRSDFGQSKPEIQAHHGSLSLERRRATEQALKAGQLKAVVATASLELGIDMGAVELVCQVESPGSVARGLQRVGRAGHLVGASSKGRLLAKGPADLLESAALAGAMMAGEVEEVRVPTNCLDVLAQQVVACVAMGPWAPADLFNRVRCAYPYRDLTPAAFEGVLELVAGRFAVETFRDLRPRISWDRVQNRLLALPGTGRLALVGGGTIPDTGQFPLYLGDDGPRLGELDEEFVLERRVGETFVLGTSTWRIEAIEPHRVIVTAAAGRSAMMPFWRGEGAHRTPQLGAAVGRLTRLLAERSDRADTEPWLQTEYHLDAASARVLRLFVARQVRLAGAAPDDRTVLVESFRDPAGETGLAILTPWGGRLHHALKLVLQGHLRRRLGISVTSLHADDGILIRLPGSDEPPTDVFRELTPERAEALLMEELGESPLFGLRFRQNAGRALLLPRPDPSRRAPLWLQRLRARDLLQAVRQFPDFPIVVETYRECLEDDLDLPRLKWFLERIAVGEIRVVERRGESASPFTSGLIFAFTLANLYEWDEPKGPPKRLPEAEVSEGLLAPLRGAESYLPWLDDAAVRRVEGRLRDAGRPPRTPEEMAERLRRLGDLAPSEVIGPMARFLEALHERGTVARIELDGTSEPTRWVLTEERGLYVPFDPRSAEGLVRRYLRTRTLVTLEDLTARYPIDRDLAAEWLEQWSGSGDLVRIDTEENGPRWADRRNLDDVRRVAVALKRREALAVTPEVFADFVARRQHVHPATRLEGPAALDLVLERLQGVFLTPEFWESDALPRRLRDYRPQWLDEKIASGAWSWRAASDRVAILARENLDALAPEVSAFQPPENAEGGRAGALDEPAHAVLAHLLERGASFVDQIAQGKALSPSTVRQALTTLAEQGRVTNDRFEPLRGRSRVEALTDATVRRRSGLGHIGRVGLARLEGRWSAIGHTRSDEAAALIWADWLLKRFGVVTRETAALETAAPPWRDLYAVLNVAELRGEVRRGYFVEGMSGVQFALAETVDALARPPDPGPAGALLMAALDPANLYGTGAPFDVPLLEGGTARLARRATTYLVQIAGRPVLIIEGHGQRLTGLASASDEELSRAVGLLPLLGGPSHRVLRVETYNLAPVLASPAVPWLTTAGFVRDLRGMAHYCGWT